MKPPPYDMPTIERRLTEASVEHGGDRYVRASVAMKIIGVGPGQQTRWQRTGAVNARRYRVPVSSKAPRGIVTAWPLAEVVACARTYRPQRLRNWTPAEDQLIEDQLGRISHAAIARRLSRTVVAVRQRAKHLGLKTRNAQGLLTTGDIAKLCSVSRQAVRYWHDNGLVHWTLEHDRNTRMTHPADLLVFVRRMPTWLRLSELQRQRIEVRGRDRHGAKGRAA